MKVVVTGGAGFIGSHLVDKLVALGFNVHVIDNLSTGHQQYVNPKARLHVFDIQSEDAKNVILREKPFAVFHHAAQIDVLRSFRDPLDDANVNILGTINLLSACSAASVQKFIYASCCAVYGDQETELITEESPPEPISYYGISKLVPESYIRMFHHMYGLPYTILRFANVYGPRQTPHGEGGVVSIFLDRLKKKLPLCIHGDGEQTRDFVYVKDVVTANILALYYGVNDIIQVGTSARTSVNELVETLRKVHNDDIATVHEEERPGDIRHSCLDNKKAQAKLYWEPYYDLVSGLGEAHAFVMANACR